MTALLIRVWVDSHLKLLPTSEYTFSVRMDLGKWSGQELSLELAFEVV